MAFPEPEFERCPGPEEEGVDLFDRRQGQAVVLPVLGPLPCPDLVEGPAYQCLGVALLYSVYRDFDPPAWERDVGEDIDCGGGWDYDDSDMPTRSVLKGK